MDNIFDLYPPYPLREIFREKNWPEDFKHWIHKEEEMLDFVYPGSLSEGILEHDLSKDKVVNVIKGLRVMINLQTQKLHDTMCQCFNLDQYNINA